MRSFLVLALGMLLASSALAQPPQQRNEFFVGVGDASLMFTMADLATTVGTLGLVSYEDATGGIQVVGGYQRRLNGWASAGITASWASSRRTVLVLGDDAGEAERRMTTVMADARAHWLRRPSVELYSGLALGLSNWTDQWERADEDDVDSTLGFHLIPVGIRVGRDVGVFAETGIGWHNLLKAGLSARW